jgi:hypothetical protein
MTTIEPEPIEATPYRVCQVCGELRPQRFITATCEDVSARFAASKTIFMHVWHCRDRRVCGEKAIEAIDRFRAGAGVAVRSPDHDPHHPAVDRQGAAPR